MPVSIPKTPNPTSIEANRSVGRRGVPMLWQIVDHTMQPLFPVLLAMHVNPSSLDESFTKSKTVVPTYGGYVEFLWSDELDSISASGSTGGFLNPNIGLTAGSDIEKNLLPHQRNNNIGKVGRQNSIAYERMLDLIDLFQNNGAIFDGNGIPRIRGRVRMIYDRGIFIGYFESFSVKETDDKAFSMEISWTFKVEKSQYTFPDTVK